MRAKAANERISVHAIAGTHVVTLCMNVTKEASEGLLGFALHRVDHTEGEAYWLRGFRTFEQTTPGGLQPGQLVSTEEHPIQALQWGDYTAKPEHRYSYMIVPLYGAPNSLKRRHPLTVQVDTESEDDGVHAVFFNRGVAGSQAYARRFGNRKPADVPNRAAWKWLSRGLEEAMLAYIAQADGPRWSLRGSVYEFQYRPVLDALKRAAEKGADVRIIYDARDDELREANQQAIGEAGIADLTLPRNTNPSFISHNKFLVLLDADDPVQVWTGSTNITEGGIFGQSNVGHIVRDRDVARSYLQYWERLSTDPEARKLRPKNLEATPDPTGPAVLGITPIFSPRPDLDALQWYADSLDRSARSAYLTAAFGVNDKLAVVLAKDKDYLRYLLLERPGDNFEMITRDPDVRVAIGAVFRGEGNFNEQVHRMLEETLTGLNTWVKYIHTKYMMVDPMGDSPLVITGSANFSDASTKKNDENMLIIAGNTRVADVYLSEFMRLFNHFYFRNATNRQAGRAGEEARRGTFLTPDDTWVHPYFEPGSVKEKERLLFS